MNARPAALESVAALPPQLDVEDVAHAVHDEFELTGEYELLVSERDQNFRLTTASGMRFVVKIPSKVEDPVATRLQIAALQHLERHGIDFVPRVVLAESGKSIGTINSNDGDTYRLRIVTWLDGELLGHWHGDGAARSALARDFGRRMAELDIALQDLRHDGENQILLWDTQRAAELQPLCQYVREAGLRQQLDKVLCTFEQKTLPYLAQHPRQIIHNDANSENVLVGASGNVTGLIDFGDMLKAPRIVELSTALAYLGAGDERPLRRCAAFVAGYVELCPLHEGELDLLFDLIQTRLAMSLLILHWRMTARHADDPYRQKAAASEKPMSRFLSMLLDMGRTRFRRGLD